MDWQKLSRPKPKTIKFAENYGEPDSRKILARTDFFSFPDRSLHDFIYRSHTRKLEVLSAPQNSRIHFIRGWFALSITRSH